MRSAGPVRIISAAGAVPFHLLRTAGSVHGDGGSCPRSGRWQRRRWRRCRCRRRWWGQRRARRCESRFRSARIMRTNSTLVCCGKCLWEQISRPSSVQPRAWARKFSSWTTMTKCGLPMETCDAVDDGLVGESDLGWVHLGDSHAGGDLESFCLSAMTVQERGPASVSRVMTSPAGRPVFVGDPGGDAAGAVAGDFRDGAVGVDEADAAAERACGFEEFDAIGADAGVAFAELLRQSWIAGSLRRSGSRCHRRALWRSASPKLLGWRAADVVGCEGSLQSVTQDRLPGAGYRARPFFITWNGRGMIR